MIRWVREFCLAERCLPPAVQGGETMGKVAAL
jgi:hypothetical protein